MDRLDVLFTSAEIASRDLHGKLVFPVDILRFSTTLAHAIHAGARSVVPFDSLFALRAFASAQPPEACLTAGEESGVPIPGLDLGNSPQTFTPERCAGKDVLMVTTNGTTTLMALEEARRIFPFAFVNLAKVADFARQVEGEGIVVCAGWRERFALEDALAAGLFVVESLRRDPSLQLTETAKAARDLVVRSGETVEARVRATEAARRLAELGFERD
ncbi:MAG: 2-phosphosulfolactate phosphatase, partial [Planctomycetota bacterium]